jgi:hypothetical protein
MQACTRQLGSATWPPAARSRLRRKRHSPCSVGIDGLDEDVGGEVESLCRVMECNITDAVLALMMFEQASAASDEAAFLAGHGERNRERIAVRHGHNRP